MTVLFVIPVVAMVLHYVGFSCQAQELKVGESNSNPCINVATCGACIRTASVCAWCSSSNFSRSASRCNLYDHLKNDCPKDIIYPKTMLTIAQNDNVRGGDRDRQPIQVQPQALNITARTNEPISFMLTFRQAENYPVDLYVLLDLSYTMVKEEEAQKRLVALGQEIPASLENITKDFRLGFGTFVDKTVMPYIGWTAQMLKDRCPLKDSICSPPHDFINQLKLSSDANQFATKMKAALNDVSQSFDDSEAGMDGLIQTLACEKEIGWRERSRRIIVYSSNSMFHLAGSGKLGGATKFSDGACHLDDKGSYSPGDKIYDYPSVSQIAAKLHDKSTNIIFAVMPSVFSHYERLTKFISGAVIGVLEERSANIIQLINDNYNKLRSKIDFVPRKADGIEFTLKSKCLGNVLTETSSCDGLEIKDTVIFNVSMTVTSKVCEGQSGIVERTVDLMALGLAEKLTVNLRIICDCDCEHSPQEVPNSPECSTGNGTFECGICSCNPSRYGRFCECSENDISRGQSQKQCRMNGINDTLLCSGRGECICGKCECNPLSPGSGRRFSGQYCECDDYNCQRSDDDSSLCGGPTRGVCKCGKCQCLGLWSGPACDCTTDNSTCISSSGLSCNGVGKCECGRCQCNLTTKFMGPTCEDCPNCPSKCSQYRDCAQCKGFGTGSYTKEKCDNECKHVQIVDELEEESERVRKCNFRDTENCLFHFSYQYDQQNKVVIKVQRTKECPVKVNVALIVGLVLAGVVLLPLLAICIIIFIRNRRDAAEFARFMKEKDKAKWDSGANPIYKDPKSTFQNPTYKGGK